MVECYEHAVVLRGVWSTAAVVVVPEVLVFRDDLLESGLGNPCTEWWDLANMSVDKVCNSGNVFRFKRYDIDGNTSGKTTCIVTNLIV